MPFNCGMAAVHTDAVFEKTAKFLKNMDPRLLCLKVHRRVAERATPSRETGAPCKHHSHPEFRPCNLA